MGGASAFSIENFDDLLKLAFVEELEVFLLQRADGVPRAVANHNGHQHQIYRGAEGERRIALGHLGGGLRLLRRTDHSRTGGNDQYQSQRSAATHG